MFFDKSILKRGNGPTYAAGHFDEISLDPSGMSIVGWMLEPAGRPVAPAVFIDGKLAGRAIPERRPDVSKALPWIKDASRAGFRLQSEAGVDQAIDGTHLVECVTFGDAGTISCMHTFHRRNLAQLVPAPPLPLLKQIGSPDAELYRRQGMKIFSDLIRAIEAHSDLQRVQRMLDWGCGCARVAVHFMREAPHTHVVGSDISPQAIEWCRPRFPHATFFQGEIEPPLPCRDGEFDLIIACSVFTHLQRDLQHRWLAELRRILTPEGLLLATTLGEYAYRTAHSNQNYGSSVRRQRRQLAMPQLDDQQRNTSLRHITPPDYYRNVYQARSYTEDVWGRYFEILEYVERGVGSYQDLVVMRQKG